MNELTRSDAASLNCVSYAKNPRRTRPPRTADPKHEVSIYLCTRGAQIAAGWRTLAAPLGATGVNAKTGGAHKTGMFTAGFQRLGHGNFWGTSVGVAGNPAVFSRWR